MKIYLDNCCFNRPFDDQSQLRIRLESEAKLKIQEDVRAGIHQLVWSYILDYENSRNPSVERRRQIAQWRARAAVDVVECERVLDCARGLSHRGIRNLDALHLACAIEAESTYFLTTDDTMLKRLRGFAAVAVIDPTTFIREMAE